MGDKEMLRLVEGWSPFSMVEGTRKGVGSLKAAKIIHNKASLSGWKY